MLFGVAERADGQGFVSIEFRKDALDEAFARLGKTDRDPTPIVTVGDAANELGPWSVFITPVNVPFVIPASAAT